MKRTAALILALAAVAAFVVASAGAGGDAAGRKYTVELANAFGVVEGADLKIAGVRAGHITDMRIDRATKRALVDFTVTKLGFGSLRTDAFCETRPQSLIGEYFVDCTPGTAKQELRPGSTIPISQTASTVPGDLLNNIMRRPERERLRIILNEIGAGVGARAEDLNDAVRRASPALRETDKVLAVLGDQNTILRDLVTDADKVITELAGNKKDVARWVSETRETSAASAERRADIAGGLRRLPTFLRELRPTMAELGRVADAQAPSLNNLQASAGQLETLFDNLAPFAKSSQANLASLGDAARKGRPAVKAALPVAQELGRFSAKAPEVAKNASFILKHLDDRNFAVEKDPRSPGGQGYTGFEALLQYLYDQAMAINVFDANGYILKVNVFFSECGDYQNAQTLKAKLAEDPKFYERCASTLGPNQQGINQPDPTATTPPAAKKKRKKTRHNKKDGKVDEAPAPAAEEKPQAKPPIDLGETLGDLLDGKLPDLIPGLDPTKPGLGLDGLSGLAGRGSAQSSPAARTALLDFLFGS